MPTVKGYVRMSLIALFLADGKRAQIQALGPRGCVVIVAYNNRRSVSGQIRS